MDDKEIIVNDFLEIELNLFLDYMSSDWFVRSDTVDEEEGKTTGNWCVVCTSWVCFPSGTNVDKNVTGVLSELCSTEKNDPIHEEQEMSCSFSSSL